MTKLFIGGFSLDMTEIKLVQLIAPFADVVTIKLVYDRATKISKGYGFVEVPDETHAHRAIENLNGIKIGDRELLLNIVPEVAPQSSPVYRKPERRFATDRPGRPRRPRL